MRGLGTLMVLCLVGWPATQRLNAGLPLGAAAQELPPAAAAALRSEALRRSAARVDGGTILLRSGAFDPLTSAKPRARIRPASPPAGPRAVYLVQFRRQIRLSDLKAVERPGLRFLDRISSNACLARADASGLSVLEAMPELRWIGPYLPDEKISPALTVSWERAPFLSVRLFPGEDPWEALGRLRSAFPDLAGAQVLGSSEDGALLRFLPPSAVLPAVVAAAAGDAAVWSVDPWLPPHVRNDDSIWVVQSFDTANRTAYALSATLWNQGLTGTGQIAAVADSGLDSDECFFIYGPEGVTEAQSPLPPAAGPLDLTRKVVGYDVLPGATPYDGLAFFNHGTHTTGSVAGDNYATPSTPTSGGHDFGDGMAPNAKIFFQDAGNEGSGTLAGLATDNQIIYQQAFNAGARIHSDSWGSDTAGIYTDDCLWVDRFLYRHEEFQLFFACGNAGPETGTVGSPAAAKDCITVGAVTNGDYGADAVTGFSSRGPTLDGRMKPDLCAPGQVINSALGDDSHSSMNCGTTIMSGTSMAAPTAAGAALLLRQYFTDGFYPSGLRNPADSLTPSGALIKAALVNGAMDVAAPDIPNESEGWGRVRLDAVCAFASPRRGPRRLRVWDKRNGAGLATGEEDRFAVGLSSGTPLKVTLAWTDPEASPVSGPALVNDLDLEVTGPDGVRYLGNVFSEGASVPGGTPDALNTVEEVLVPAPSAGTWTVAVRGASVPGTPSEAGSDRQGYALVATYADCQDAPEPPVSLTATDAGEGAIALSWPATGAPRYRIERACGDSPAEAGSFHFLAETDGSSFRDTLVQGGFGYGYRVRAQDGCGEGPASPCAFAAFAGNCTLAPTFDGVRTADGSPSGPTCSVVLSWLPGASSCPLAPGVAYNVYRGSDPYFTPSAVSRVASGLTGTTFTDSTVLSGITYYYVVRAEDGTRLNGGPANGGNEEANARWLSVTPTAGTFSPGTWTDDGGDTAALLRAEPPWTVTRQDNHTASGGLCYRSAQDGRTYPANLCASLTTPELPLQEGTPQLTYWARYNLEVDYDGVVVEISADAGSTWQTLVPAGGYPGTLSLTEDPPINACAYPASQGCFTGPAGNACLTPWTPYTQDLSPYAGRRVRIRWRLTTDPGAEFDGFELDDLQITGAGVPDPCKGTSDEPPQVTVSTPQAGASVHGTVRLAAAATDDRGVSEVTFLVDGTPVGRAETQPWQIDWDSAGMAGPHTLTARATDTAGQKTTSDPVGVTLDNPALTAVRKLGSPFRLLVSGSGFQEGSQVLLAETPAPRTQFRKASELIAKGGGDLKAMLPEGSPVWVRIVNPDGGRSGVLPFSR